MASKFDEMYEKALSSGWLDQRWKEAKDAAEHASMWLEATRHLHDPESLPEMDKTVRMAQRGILNSDETNHKMRMLSSTYPHFTPPTSPHINIPDHLGDQFR